jgi:ATP-dependent Lon protease
MPSSVPVLPLRELVVFPFTEHTILLGRPMAVRAVHAALASYSQLVLVAQKDANVAEPRAEDFFEIGTLATIVRHVPLPRDEMKIVVRGESRARVTRCVAESDGSFRADAELIDGDAASSPEHRRALEELLAKRPGVRAEVKGPFSSDTHLAFAVAGALLERDFDVSQKLLEADTVVARLEHATRLLASAPKTKPEPELDEIAQMEALLRAKIAKKKK